MIRLAKPSKQLLEWAEAELGVFFHFDIEVFHPEYDSGKGYLNYPPVGKFNPALLDTDKWVKIALEAGAKYALLTAKHGTGFCLWPTKIYDYSVRNAPWRGGKGDIVGDFVASCRKFGIKPGLYYNTGFNSYMGTRDGTFSDKKLQEKYNEVVLGHLEELFSNYGDLFEVWFDGGIVTVQDGGPDIAPLLKRLQPEIIAFEGPSLHPQLLRWSGSEQGVSEVDCWSTSDFYRGGEHVVRVRPEGNPDGTVWAPVEADMPPREIQRAYMGGWMWHEGEERLVYDADYLFSRYCTTVGRNSNLLIGALPDTGGLIPEADANALRGLGRLVKEKLGKPLAEASGAGFELRLQLPGVSDVERVVLMEDQSDGQKIRKWVLEGLWPESWGEGWFELEKGCSVGHKRILELGKQRFTALRLRVLEAAGEPLVRSLAAYGREVL